jgi:hypothetical protein
MDKGKREKVTQDIFDAIAVQVEVLHQQAVEHLDTIEYLEENFRLDLRAFTVLYGSEILDGTKRESCELLDVWKRLYESLAREDTVTVISNERRTGDAIRRMSPTQKQVMPETFREGVMVIGKGTILFNEWINEDDPLMSAKIVADELYRFDEQGVERSRTKEFTLATTDGLRSFSPKRVNTTVMTPGADILDLAITEQEGGQIEIQKGPIVRSYPTALYRTLKDFQTTAR